MHCVAHRQRTIVHGFCIHVPAHSSRELSQSVVVVVVVIVVVLLLLKVLARALALALALALFWGKKKRTKPYPQSGALTPKARGQRTTQPQNA